MTKRLYGEYLVLKSFGHGIYTVEFGPPIHNIDLVISFDQMREKIQNLGFLSIQEIVMDPANDNRAFIMTTNAPSPCTLEEEQVTNEDLLALDVALKAAKDEFRTRALLLRRPVFCSSAPHQTESATGSQ